MVYLDQKRDIEEKLGEEINLDRIQKSTSLNDTPESLIKKFRTLNATFFKECLISYYVTDQYDIHGNRITAHRGKNQSLQTRQYHYNSNSPK